MEHQERSMSQTPKLDLIEFRMLPPFIHGDRSYSRILMNLGNGDVVDLTE